MIDKNWTRISQFDCYKKLHLFKGHDAKKEEMHHISANDPR